MWVCWVVGIVLIVSCWLRVVEWVVGGIGRLDVCDLVVMFCWVSIMVMGKFRVCCIMLGCCWSIEWSLGWVFDGVDGRD